VACTGSPQAGSGAFVPAGVNPAQSARSDDGRSWMASDAMRSDLLYISDANANVVDVFSYPQLKPEGKLTGFNGPWGECVDKHGNVFIANDNAYQILEYAHGGTQPIATLSDPGYYPRGCSIDPTTGNLAVANIVNTSLGEGNIAIYKNAKGNPSTYYADSHVFNVYSCGYDSSGNLFIDGENEGSSSFAFAELASGARKFTNITLNQPIKSAGGLQWDGKYVAVGDQYTNIYQFSIHGKTGTKVGTTPLNGAGRDAEFWIKGSNVIVPDSDKLHVAIWDYPAGGSAEQRVKGFQYPIGATVSVAK
jgi:hypothetical protein